MWYFHYLAVLLVLTVSCYGEQSPFEKEPHPYTITFFEMPKPSDLAARTEEKRADDHDDNKINGGDKKANEPGPQIKGNTQPGATKLQGNKPALAGNSLPQPQTNARTGQSSATTSAKVDQSAQQQQMSQSQIGQGQNTNKPVGKFQPKPGKANKPGTQVQGPAAPNRPRNGSDLQNALNKSPSLAGKASSRTVQAQPVPTIDPKLQKQQQPPQGQQGKPVAPNQLGQPAVPPQASPPQNQNPNANQVGNQNQNQGLDNKPAAENQPVNKKPETQGQGLDKNPDSENQGVNKKPDSENKGTNKTTDSESSKNSKSDNSQTLQNNTSSKGADAEHISLKPTGSSSAKAGEEAKQTDTKGNSANKKEEKLDGPVGSSVQIKKSSPGKQEQAKPVKPIRKLTPEQRKKVASFVSIYHPSSDHDKGLSFQKGAIKHPKHTMYPHCHHCPRNSSYSECVRRQTIAICNDGLKNICYTKSHKRDNIIHYEMGCADHKACTQAKAFPCRDGSKACFTCCQWDRCNSSPHHGDFELDSINLDQMESSSSSTAMYQYPSTLAIVLSTAFTIILQKLIFQLL